jgi:ABC-2 type transport system permease protein
MNTLAFDAISRASLRLDARLEFLRLLRSPSFSVPALAFPVMFYLLFGVVMMSGKASSAQIGLYMMASYSVFGVMGPGLFGFGVAVAIERDKGLLMLKRAMPMPEYNYVAAKLIMSLLFAAIIFCLMFTAASVAGGVRLDAAQWLMLAPVLLLGVLPFCALGLLVGSTVSGQAAPAVINLIYLPMAFLSGLWMPLSLLPSFVQALAPAWPAWHLLQLALAVTGQAAQGNAWMHVAYLLLFTLLVGGWAARRLQREP